MPYIETEARYKSTTMREIRNGAGDLNGYDIAPLNGYVLHNSALDVYDIVRETQEQDTDEIDQETQEQGELISKGYSPSSCSVEPDYDFEANPREIYAKKIDDIGDDEIIY